MTENEALNSVSADTASSDSSSYSSDGSSLGTSVNSDNSDYTATIIKNQNTIIENQYTAISILGTIAFLLIISIGIYLAFKFGKFIQNLIN